MRKIIEDELLTDKLVKLLAKTHLHTVYNDVKYDVQRHIYINGLEVDTVITFYQKFYRFNEKAFRKFGRIEEKEITRRITIGLELKRLEPYSSSEIIKAVKQAVLRRRFFTYFYIVFSQTTPRLEDSIYVDESLIQVFTSVITNDKVRQVMKIAYSCGIGLIIHQNREYYMLMKSDFKKKQHSIYWVLKIDKL